MLKVQVLAKTTMYTLRAQHQTTDELSNPEQYFRDNLLDKTLQLSGLSLDLTIESLNYVSSAVIDDTTIYNFIVTVSE